MNDADMEMGLDVESLRFEEAYARLEETLEEMRQDGLALDRALALYEQGTRLAARCDRLLEQAELRVSTLAPGEPVARVIRETEVIVESEW